MFKKIMPLALALALILALIPAIPAAAADTNPWTGVWTDNLSNTTGKAYVFWQDGDTVVGAYTSNATFEGMVSGNTLTGTAYFGEKRDRKSPISLTISADGKSISINPGTEAESGFNKPMTKISGYSALTPDYNNDGGAISWTGLWFVNNITWGGMIIAQDGDKVTGYTNQNGGKFTGTVSGNVLNGTYLTGEDGVGYIFRLTMSADGKTCKPEKGHASGGAMDSDWNDGVRLSPITYVPAVINASDWAQPEIQKAADLGLIPDSLKDADLTKPITRAEFAAVSVKVYEALSGVKAIPAVTNPFTDTKDVEVLKAYNLNLVNGTSATTYDPNTILNRESAATLLTRVFKKVSMPGWSLATDGQFQLQYTKPAVFADDAQISDWAKDSVYFMVANNIITGMGNYTFAPKNTTSSEEAQGYANATREQALIIAVRMVENLK